jgi:hypothetical protein
MTSITDAKEGAYLAFLDSISSRLVVKFTL